MDKNKLEKLHEINYVIQKSCKMCNHFRSGVGLFGTCKVNTYEHLKHTIKGRELSVFESGYCDSFEMKMCMYPLLVQFLEFIK